jgi:hypothetical protein
VYTKAWFSATSAIAAPAGDLSLLKRLACYPDEQIAKATSEKFANHLWYLGKKLSGLSLFDANVAVEIKHLVVAGVTVTMTFEIGWGEVGASLYDRWQFSSTYCWYR